ncbi:DrmB family protein [Paenarthrobacter sp. NPDC089714]|uniref:DrmB family protein n=1 Tax=Paenarthrobacter sp. NPDC089714 TaxID=3364377 RepID=UPI0037F917D1
MQRKIRQSQTIVPFGVGAIFDFKGESLVGCDTFRWGSRGESIRSERLAAALGVAQFRAAPAVASNASAPSAAGVPYARFPTWLFCQKCRRMTRWRRSLEQEGKAPTCGSCPGKKPLVPMRWIQICAKGHMDDADWRRWAHSKSTSLEARQCQKDNLFFETLPGKGAGGLDTLQVHCRSCKSRRNLMGITTKGSLKGIGSTCGGRQPWQRFEEKVDCDEIPIAVQRGASNVYFPLVHSSIEIPNPSRSDAYSEKALAIKADDFFRPLLTVNEAAPMFDMMVQTLANGHEVDPGFVKALARDEKQREAGMATAVVATPGDLLGEEWAAFLTPTENSDDPHFRTRHVSLTVGTGDPDKTTSLLTDRIDKVVLADRLREVRALEGFHRVKPGGKDVLVKAALKHPVNWLPAIDVRGEGIFLSLDETRLSVWEERDDVRARLDALDRRLDASFMAPRLRERSGPVLAPRYVLLHTFAHLLIRRLAFESGYAATSLRERIYARSSPEVDGTPKQAGILIYTAAGDSEGTLGGLVRQGEPPVLQTTMLEALQDAMWCSSDPLCSENLASTFDSLNLAACHACTLVAETSCESGNYLLDRAMVTGNDQVQGYFEPVLDAAVMAAGEAVKGIG